MSDFKDAQSLLDKERERQGKTKKKAKARGCPLHMDDGVCRMSKEIPRNGDILIPFACNCQDYFHSCGIYMRHGKF